jgi:cytochrome c biogenesis protein CcmG, thiol:disulfide interchange protein DsbE
MKFTPALKATLVVLVIAGGLFFGWAKYHDFLNRGRQAPESVKFLNNLEKNGVPDFNLKDIDGREVSLTKFRGKLVVLNFWASWCDPCVSEFPSLLKLIDHFKGQILFLGVSGDYELVDVRKFLQLFKVKDPSIYIVWDKDLDLAKKYGTYRLPESYIIGVDGKLIRKVVGVDNWASANAIDYFADLLKK